VVHAPFVVIDKSIDVDQQRFAADGDMYAALDQRLLNYMEQAAGAYITANPNAQGQPVTATEASQDAKREQESSDITEARWFNQFMEMVQIMQERAFTDENIDEATKFFKELTQQMVRQEDGADKLSNTINKLIGDSNDESKVPIRTLVNMMIDGMTEQEIKILRSAPSTGYAHTDDAIVAQGILAVAKMYANNPNVDQVVLTQRGVEALAGPDAAKALVIPGADQTITAEAVRMQISEVTSMKSLQIPVPVSPRDNHLIHGQVCMQMLQKAGQSLSSLETFDQAAKPTELLINHFAEHLAGYLAQGNPSQNQQFKEMNEFYKRFKVQYAQAVQVAQQAKIQNELVSLGASPETLAAAAQGTPPIPGGIGAGVQAPAQSPESGVSPEGPDVEAVQTALAREAGQMSPDQIEDRQKRAYYRPPGVE
jgi:2-oxo-4-hydroxy-4-carboxy--5-ureidoimidazoline (OHCU) decarboxylase